MSLKSAQNLIDTFRKDSTNLDFDCEFFRKTNTGVSGSLLRIFQNQKRVQTRSVRRKKIGRSWKQKYTSRATRLAKNKFVPLQRETDPGRPVNTYVLLIKSIWFSTIFGIISLKSHTWYSTYNKCEMFFFPASAVLSYIFLGKLIFLDFFQ